MAEHRIQSKHLRTLTSSIFLISFPFGLLFFTLPFLGKEMGASALAIAGLYSAFFFMTVLLRPVVGWALDRYGRRPFLLGGFLGYLVANLTFLWVHDVKTLYLARVAQSFGSSFTWLSAYAIVADLSESDRRGRNFGRIDQSNSRATIAGVLIFFSIYLGLRQLAGTPDSRAMDVAWTASFALFALLGVYALFRVRSVPETITPKGGGAFWKSYLASWRHLSRPLLNLMVIVFLTTSAYQSVAPLVLIFLQERFGATLMELAWAFVPMALIWAVLPSRMGAVGDRVGRKAPMAVGLLISGFAALLMPNVPSLLALAVLLTIEAIAFTASIPAEEAMVADLCGSDQRGEGYGMYTFAKGLGAVVGPLIGGWLYDHTNQLMPFYYLACCVFLGAFLVLLLVRDPRRPSARVDAQARAFGQD